MLPRPHQPLAGAINIYAQKTKKILARLEVATDSQVKALDLKKLRGVLEKRVHYE